MTIYSLEEQRDEALKKTLAHLREGRIVAVPTETVFGLMIRADDLNAVESLYVLKGRADQKPLAVYVSDQKGVERLIPELPPFAAKLMAQFWPGPLTLVLMNRVEEYIGFRCSSSRFLREILTQADFPLVGTSANRSGAKELADTSAIAREFGTKIAAIIEPEVELGGKASTVLRIGNNGALTVLREGALSATELLQSLKMHLLFVCTGNTCRSPLAEALMQHQIEEASKEGLPLDGLSCSSAGLGAAVGHPASQHSNQVASEMGFDLDAHQARQLDDETLAKADAVYTMTAAQQEIIIQNFPKYAAKIKRLIPAKDVQDPYGANLDTYRDCAQEISAAIEQIWRTL